VSEPDFTTKTVGALARIRSPMSRSISAELRFSLGAVARHGRAGRKENLIMRNPEAQGPG
jgi:hypothetical protein